MCTHMTILVRPVPFNGCIRRIDAAGDLPLGKQGFPLTQGMTSQWPETEARFPGMITKSKPPDRLS